MTVSAGITLGIAIGSFIIVVIGKVVSLSSGAGKMKQHSDDQDAKLQKYDEKFKEYDVRFTELTQKTSEHTATLERLSAIQDSIQDSMKQINQRFSDQDKKYEAQNERIDGKLDTLRTLIESALTKK